MSRLYQPAGRALILLLSLITPIVSAQAQVLFSSYPNVVLEGNSYAIVWGTNSIAGTNRNTTVQINLWKGANNDKLSKISLLDEYTTLGGVETFSWNVSTTLTPADDYALEVVFADGTSPNYSSQITILAAGTTGTATAQSAPTGALNRPSSAVASTSDVSSTSTASASSTASPNHKSGLGGGAIAGIVIAFLAGISLVLLAALFILRHRRNAGKSQHVQHNTDFKERIPTEDSVGTAEGARVELGGREIGMEEKRAKDRSGVRELYG